MRVGRVVEREWTRECIARLVRAGKGKSDDVMRGLNRKRRTRFRRDFFFFFSSPFFFFWEKLGDLVVPFSFLFLDCFIRGRFVSGVEGSRVESEARQGTPFPQ